MIAHGHTGIIHVCGPEKPILSTQTIDLIFSLSHSINSFPDILRILYFGVNYQCPDKYLCYSSYGPGNEYSS